MESSVTKMPGIEMLPEELLAKILKYLSLGDRLNCATAYKRFAEALTHPQLLKDIWFTVRREGMGTAAPVLIKSCRRYQNLRLFGVHLHKFDSEFWERIGGTLRRLALDECWWRPEVLYDILRECSGLECLGIACDSALDYRFLPQNPETCGTSVKDVRTSLSNVKHLHLRTHSVDVVGHLLGLIPNVSSISLKVSREGFLWETLINSTLADPRVVTELDLDRTPTSDAELILIMQAFSEGLRELRLDGIRLTHRAGAAVAKCARLRRLSLRRFRELENTQMTTILRSNPGLEMLDLIDCTSLSDDGLSTIHELKNLRRLKIHDCRSITNELLGRLGEILTLEYGDSRSTQLDLMTIQSITSLKNLEGLHLDSYVQSSESLRMICMNLGELQTLSLGDCRNLSDADGLMLSRLRRLRSLELRYAYGFKDLMLEGGIGGSEMESLTVFGSSLTDQGVLNLVGRHGRLKNISLYGCQITDRGIMTLLPRAPLLEKLDLTDCRYIKCEFIEALGECCPRLRSVYIWDCARSCRPLESFQERRPKVFVSFLSEELDDDGYPILTTTRLIGKLAESYSFWSD